MHSGTTASSPAQDRWRVAIPRAPSPAALFRPQGEVVVLEGAAMGTSWRVSFVGARAAAPSVQRAVVGILDRVVSGFSPWETDSELNRFNATPPGTWHAASADFAKVLGCALRIAEESGGACDPALGSLIDLWGFGPAPSRAGVPSAVEVEQALRASGWRQIEHDAIGNRFAREALARLDLCGVAKGYAVDLVAQTVREAGAAAALVEIGGELSGFGVKPDGSPWWVAVDGDAGTDAPIMAALHGMAIATSGNERCFTHAGKIYSHTIDQRTGSPIDNGMVSATVLHASCMQADACATALMVLGADASMAFAETLGLAALVRYRESGKLVERISTQLQAMLDD